MAMTNDELANKLKKVQIKVDTTVSPAAIEGKVYDDTGAVLETFNDYDKLSDFLEVLCAKKGVTLPALAYTSSFHVTDYSAFNSEFKILGNRIVPKTKAAAIPALVSDTKEVLVELKNGKAQFKIKRISGKSAVNLDKINDINEYLKALCAAKGKNVTGLINNPLIFSDLSQFTAKYDIGDDSIKEKKVVDAKTALVNDTKDVIVELKNDKAQFTVNSISGKAPTVLDNKDDINEYLKALCAAKGKTVTDLINVTLKFSDLSKFQEKYKLDKDSISEITATKEEVVNDTDHVKFEFNNDKVEILLVKKDGSSEKINDLDIFNEFLEFACNMKGKTAKELDGDGFFKTNDKTKFYGGVYEFDGNKIVEKSKKKKKDKTKNTSNKTSSGKLKKIAKRVGCLVLAGGFIWLGIGIDQLLGDKLRRGGTNGTKVLDENGMSSEGATVDFGSVTYDPEADVIRDAHEQEFDLIDAHDLNNADAVNDFMEQIKYYTRNPDGHSLADVAAPADKSTMKVIDDLLCDGSSNSIQQIEGYVMDGNTVLFVNGEGRTVVAFNNLDPLDKGIPLLALGNHISQCTRADALTGGDGGGKVGAFLTAVEDKIVSLGGARGY